MSDLPANLTYFGSIQKIGQIITKRALPLVEAHELNDPFLPDKNSQLPFTVSQMFDNAVKHIAHAILGASSPRGQPNHPLQKAIIRWRMENRFSDESEVKEALQGLLPAMVEKAFNEAKETHQAWLDFVKNKKLAILYEKNQDLALWKFIASSHRGAAIKFKCEDDSIFNQCHPVSYDKKPASTVSLKDYTAYMVGDLPKVEFDVMSLILNQDYSLRTYKEWRLITDSNDTDDQWLEFPMSAIQSVYLGALVPEKIITQLKNHLLKTNPKIKVYQAKVKALEYGLDFEKISENPDDNQDAKD